MASRTLAKLMANAREHADMEGSPFIADVQLIGRINDAAARLRRRLIHNLGGDIARSMASYVTVAGVATIDLTGTPFRLDGVDVLFGDDWVPCKKFNFNDRNKKQRIQGWTRGSVRYRVENLGDPQPRLRFIPTPQAVHNVRVWFLAGHTELSAPGDLLYLPDDYFEWIELTAAIKSRTKASLDTRALIAERKEAEADMDVVAHAIDQDEPEVVRDVEGTHDYQDGFEIGLREDLSLW